MREKRLLLIINPVSGRMALRPKLWQVLERLCAAGYLPTVRFTEKRGDATTFAKACPKEIGTVVCAGGDGTLNEVICGLMENPYHHTLGYLPVGTTNDLAASLGLSKGILKATEDIISGTPRQIDIGRFSGRYFSYVASFGAFTEASYNTPQDAKNTLGHLAYLLEGVMSLANIRPYPARFLLDGREISGEFIFAAISNTTSLGGVLRLKERLVSLNDGKLELLLVRAPTTLQQLNNIIGELLSQQFTGEDVQLLQAERVTVITEEPLDWTLDGECQPAGKEVVIENIPGAIELIAP